MDRRVSIVGCENYQPETVEQAMDALFAPLDALGWVKPGMKIAVKSNLVIAHEPEKAATPHPQIVDALCRRLTERGAQVVVGDSPGGPFRKSYLDAIYRATGMTRVVGDGVRLNDNFGETEVAVPEGRVLHSFWCSDYLLEADAIIDLCKLKTHALMGYTGACKNMFGAVTGTHKTEFHYRFPNHGAFASMLVDLCGFLKPCLSICDGVLAMEGNGPSYGDPRHVGVLLASFNPHALDLLAADLIGLGKDDVPTLAEAADRGLIPESAGELTLFTDPAPYRVPDFKLQPRADIRYWGIRSEWFHRIAKRLLVSRPQPDSGCIGCGKCADVCPARAIVMEKHRPRINRNLCISCFCCSEFCPKGAMKAYEPLLGKLTRGKRNSHP